MKSVTQIFIFICIILGCGVVNTQALAETQYVEKNKVHNVKDNETEEDLFDQYDVLQCGNVEYATFLGSVEYSTSIKNISENPVSNIEMTFCATNNNSIIMSTGFNSIDEVLNSGETVSVDGFITGIDQKDISNLKDCHLIEYSYVMLDKEYNIDYKYHKYKVRDHVLTNEIDFEQVNIISIENAQEVDTGDKCVYRLTYTAINNGKSPICKFVPVTAFYSSFEQYLGRDYVDSVLENGKCYVNGDKDEIKDPGEGWEMIAEYADYENPPASCKLIGYTYSLEEPDENGYDRYTINLETKTAQGFSN